MEALAKLQRWYESQCNGEWEHHHGISIESCDNPGWWVKISLDGTPLELHKFEPITHGALGDSSSGWLRCYIEDGKWHGASNQLPPIIEAFLRWVDSGD